MDRVLDDRVQVARDRGDVHLVPQTGRERRDSRLGLVASPIEASVDRPANANEDRLEGLGVLQRGSRLSVMPVSAAQARELLKMAEEDHGE